MPKEQRSTQDSEHNYTHLLKNHTKRDVLTKMVYRTSGKGSHCKGKVTQAIQDSEHASNISSSTQTLSL